LAKSTLCKHNNGLQVLIFGKFASTVDPISKLLRSSLGAGVKSGFAKVRVINQANVTECC